MSPRFILFGNPENRRVTLFQDAMTAQALPPAEVIPWRDVLHDFARVEALSSEPALVRLDSVGEDFEVERALLKLGHGEAKRLGVSTIDPSDIDALSYDRGLILCPRQQHLGFLSVLQKLERLFQQRPAWRILNPTQSVATLFDKRETSRLYESRGIPVPPRIDSVSSVDELRQRMDERDCQRAFVKLSCSSSASCLAIYRRGTNRDSIFTTIEQANTGWYNTLRPRLIESSARVDEIIGFLLREGSQVEEEVPKAKLAGNPFDCRVLVVAGEPAFLVVRQNRHPITNLHLRGWRGDPEALKREAPADIMNGAMESCRKVYAAHDCLHVGVDLMFERDFTGHRVIEANAFGDLLPNLKRDGLSVYEWEIRAALQDWARPR
jgi:glutathione synthase/RimK-type ligase-like ATP-grasp enzyme